MNDLEAAREAVWQLVKIPPDDRQGAQIAFALRLDGALDELVRAAVAAQPCYWLNSTSTCAEAVEQEPSRWRTWLRATPEVPRCPSCEALAAKKVVTA